MNIRNLVLLLTFSLVATPLRAQHSDIEFGYDNLTNPTGIEIEGDEMTSDGIKYWDSEFVQDPFAPGNFFSDEPGFTTNASEGLLVGANDRIFVRVLNASGNSAFGVGFVNFYNPVTGTLQASAARRMMAEQNTTALPNLIFNGLTIESPSNSNPVFLGAANSTGNLHEHILFDLLDDTTAPFGAYGVLFQLEADRASNGFGSIDVTSDKFWIIWNHGMSAGDFENLALPAFGAIPEPSSMTLLSIAAMGCMLRRRRGVS